MSDPNYTVDELIGILQASSAINLIVEGDDESFIFRRIREKLNSNVELLICNTCTVLKELYKRKDEYKTAKTIFLADKDLGVFKPTILENGIIYSQGYSIENDLLNNSVIWFFLSESERENFDSDLRLILDWYNIEISKYLSNSDFKIKVNPKKIINNGSYLPEYNYVLSEKITNLIPKGKEKSYLRGKTLLKLLMKYLSDPKRGISYATSQIFDISLVDGKCDFCSIIMPLIIKEIEVLK